MAIATSIAIGLAVAAGTAGGAAIAAHETAGAAKEGAQLQTTAANHAADLQSAAADKTLALTKQQAETDWRNSQQTQRANYDQWAAREGRLSSLGAMVGLGPREIPAFSEGVDPHFDTGPTAPGPTATPATAAGGDPILAALTKNYADLGVKPTGPGSGPTDIEYMAKRVGETGGLTPDNVKYWFGPGGRIAQELKGAGGTGTPKPASFATLINGAPAPETSPILAPALQTPRYSFADMVGGR